MRNENVTTFEKDIQVNIIRSDKKQSDESIAIFFIYDGSYETVTEKKSNNWKFGDWKRNAM